MDLNYQKLLPQNFHNNSRAWVYQASRLFTINEAFKIEVILNEFTSNWMSHGDKVKGTAHLFFGQFIILMADETATGVSGCSTDSSVRIIKEIESQFGVNMFDRNNLAFFVKDKIQLLPLSQIQYAISNGFINANTLYFNNLIETKEELENKWIVPIKDSWLVNKISFTKTGFVN